MTNDFFTVYFNEKQLPFVQWEISSADGTWNLINNEVVIEAIKGTIGSERRSIELALRKIDICNGDVNDYLRHLAGALVGEGA